MANSLTAEALATWDTAVQYQLVHAIALVLTAMLSGSKSLALNQRALATAGFGFLVGIVLFSGSLYVLALGGPRVFGPVTPFGGVAFVIGWLALATSVFGRRPS